ncbi:27492_t:CDS:1 [Gigaspora margarita]|uniref:27492_t:CDS:1 n=1 Tax=Gigaspora margarita TaxID=4874 RepID=A0ABN7V3C1_GIGMA|nr:27492_t:CDS:1 [Gigaspora margarita]
MQCKGGKPQHSLSEFFYIIPNEWANKCNKKWICRACMEAIGSDNALQDKNMKITNTKRYCANHLRSCSYFAAKYSSEQINHILSSATSSKEQAHTDDEEENDSTHSSNSLLA